MKITQYTTIALLLFCLTTFAQPGTNDSSFNTSDSSNANYNSANNLITSTSIQNDGKTIILGDFTTYNEIASNKIARLNSDGSLDTTFNTGTGFNGSVYSSSIQSDGKIIVVGGFNYYNGTVINKIARLNTNGSIDSSFNPATGPNGAVYTTYIQSDGKIIIGGAFSTYNGSSRNRIARLNTDGSLDTTFNPGSGFDGAVSSASLQSDGKIIVVGGFTAFNGASRNKIARLNTDGSLDATFNPGTGPDYVESSGNTALYTTTVLSNGKIIIGGFFSSYNGSSIDRIARLNTDGSLDTTFNIGVPIMYAVKSTAIQSDGKIIIGGNFSIYALSLTNIARLNSDGSIDTTFNVVAGNDILTISIQSDSRIIIGGDLYTYYNGSSKKHIARLNINGSLDTTFNPGIETGANDKVRKTSIQSDGKIIIGGDFTFFNGTARNHIARLNTNGSLDATFNQGTGTNGTVYTTSIQSDGKIIIGGAFSTYNGSSRNRIARLNTDGSLDTTFNPGSGFDSTVFTSSIQSDGKIIIGGLFSSYNGSTRNRIARLNSDGSLDTTFNPAVNNTVFTSSIQSDGKIIIGGDFTLYKLITINRIIRLNTNGSIDTTFNSATGTDNTVFTSSIQSDGKIIIGGLFSSYNGSTRYRIARLNSDGSLDTTFNPAVNNTVFTSSIQSDGKIIIGGAFSAYNGSSRNGIARLNADGSLDTNFNPGTGTNSSVLTTSIESNGEIIIGGWFTSYNSSIRHRIARINGDSTPTSAPTGNTNQSFCSSATITNLTATGSAIKWYPTATGGAALVNTTTLVNGTTYYASQTLNGIESTSRLAVTANITNTAAPTGNATQTFCSSATIADLTTTGTSVKWYSTSTGGTTLASSIAIVNGTTYYASQTLNSCESTNRLAITANITNTAAPTGNATQTFCSSATIADLTASGTSVKWYSTSTGGTTLASSIAIVNGTTYYASQTLNSCESTNRLAVTANITNTAAPTGNATQTLAFDSTVSNISVTGTAINWYSSATGGTSLTNSTILVNGGVYYASQTLNSCESSSRLMVTVTVSPLTLVHDNFTIQIKSETCAGKNNGEIIINAKQSYNYTATINNTSYPFTNNSLNLKDLPAGTYIVCIGITGKLFQQCYTLTIGKGGTLTGKVTGVSKNSFNVEITEGTAPFEVIINGSTKFNSNQSSFNIDVSQGDLITIKSSVSCEGIYSKTISELTASKLIAYPNPTKGMFEISVPSSLREVYLEIFTVNSNLIFKGTYPVVNQKIQLNLENLNKGVYIVKTYLDSPASLIIIKE